MPAPTAIGDPLTPTQAEVLRFAANYITLWQRPPTRAEIARNHGWASPNAAQEHIEALERKGFVAMDQGRGKHGTFRVLRWPADIPAAIQLGG